MHPGMGRVLAEMQIEELRREAAAYRLARRAASAGRAIRRSKAKRPGREAGRRVAVAPGRDGSCVEC
jgi:hypothetical protein